MAGSTDLQRYYDVMDLWTRINRGFRRFSGHETHTIHRWLIDEETGAFSADTIHKLMLPFIPREEPVVALDAGCGYGGTAFALHQRLGGTWRGLTISPRQAAQGATIATERGLTDAVTVDCGSYDEPLAATYNLIYGIESLIHAPAPEATIANLAGALRPGGVFIVVDDMPIDDVPPAYADDLAAFKADWRCPVMPSATEWSRYLENAGCEILATRDLSQLMRPRSEPEITGAIADVMRRRRWRDRFGLRRIGEAEIGGLLLERLGRERVVPYTMIVARKG